MNVLNAIILTSLMLLGMNPVDSVASSKSVQEISGVKVRHALKKINAGPFTEA